MSILECAYFKVQLPGKGAQQREPTTGDGILGVMGREVKATCKVTTQGKYIGKRMGIKNKTWVRAFS